MVTACLESNQLLLFVFAGQCWSTLDCCVGLSGGDVGAVDFCKLGFRGKLSSCDMQTRDIEPIMV